MLFFLFKMYIYKHDSGAYGGVITAVMTSPDLSLYFRATYPDEKVEFSDGNTHRI